MKIGKEDTILIQSILGGDKSSEKILYEKYKKIITDYIKKKYPKEKDIEDCVSEIIIKIFLNLEKFDSEKSSFKSWVITIIKNHMIDEFRFNNGQVSITYYDSTSICVTDISSISVSVNNDWENKTTLISCGDYYTYNSSSIVNVFENTDTINYVTCNLSTLDKTLLNMKYFNGYSYSDIGQEFNISSTTASNKVNYIKTKLKKSKIDF